MAKRPEGTPDEELEAFARRMIDEVEDLDYIGTRADWATFVNDKFYANTGRILTNAQLDALEMGRLPLYQFAEQLGMRAETPFITRPEQIRYRDITGEFQAAGTWVSRAQISARIEYFKRLIP